MKKSAIVLIAVLAVGLIILAAFLIFSGGKTVESAIREYEDGDYVDAIVILNRLKPTAGYEAAEKIYYYRCRSLNRLAERLEEKYDDELREASLSKKNTDGYRKAKKKIEEKLASVNMKTGGDLVLVPGMKQSRIAPRGAFYEEFVSRYRGSAYIEDLHFDEILKLGRSDPDKQLPAIAAFYEKYPGTDYIAQMSKILFDIMHRGDARLGEHGETVKKVILAYIKKYPTSAEISRLYTCKGDNVNMRNSPGLDGKLVGKVAKDEILVQLEKSMDTYQVGDTRDYWYRVSGMTGQRGWIFGKFVTPLDTSKYRSEEDESERWTLEERFAEWSDSHTPENWKHVDDADPGAINFTARKDGRIAVLDSPNGKRAGLYTRFSPARAFSLQIRARFTGGDNVTVVAVVTGEGKVFAVNLREEQLEISGRTIPLHTADWHEYSLSSDDGRYVKLRVDGEVLASRIEAGRQGPFTNRGVYILYSSQKESSMAEAEYVRAR